MSTPEGRDATCHRLLLSLAGRISDDRLRAARQVLAEGEVRRAAVLVLQDLAEHGVPVTSAELETAADLAENGELFEALSQETGFLVVSEMPDLPYQFFPAGPTASTRADRVDDAVVLLAESSADRVAGVWRAWRRSVFAEEPDRRVYLVQTDYLDDAPALAADFYTSLRDTGESAAGVEVVELDAELSGYQRRALDEALLLWARDGDGGPEFQAARVYDAVHPEHGPSFAPDHPLITDLAERSRVLAYLAGGRPVLSTTARTPDPLNPAAGEVVPLSFLTDGEWIWTEAVGYFLQTHGLAPDAAFLAHIRHAGYVPDSPDDATVSRASAFLLAPDEND